MKIDPKMKNKLNICNNSNINNNSTEAQSWGLLQQNTITGSH